MTTLEDESMQNLMAIYSDVYKDVNGFRPRNNFSEFSREKLISELNSLSDELEVVLEEDKAREAAYLTNWDSEVSKVMEYAPDRASALRWLTDQEDFANSQDVEHFVYNLGFLFTDEGKALVKELCDLYEMYYSVN
jgi:hypothetical protein